MAQAIAASTPSTPVSTQGGSNTALYIIAGVLFTGLLAFSIYEVAQSYIAGYGKGEVSAETKNNKVILTR